MARKPRARKRAVAIKGVERDRVSTSIAAKGTGKLADKIIALAKENGVPVKEDPDLVGLLAKLDLEQALPPELYPLIAELLGFAYKLNQAAGEEGLDASEPAAAQTGEGAEEAEQAAGERTVTVEADEAIPDDLPQPRRIVDDTDPPRNSGK